MSTPLPQYATARADIERVSPALVATARGQSAATLHEAAGRIGALPHAIRPLADSFTVCGPALTVSGPAGDNLWLHRAIYFAQPGDVLVAYVSGGFEYGYWGDIMTAAARERGLGGLVIDACVRDGAVLRQAGFPIFSRGLALRGTGKDFGATGWINHPLLIGEITVVAGDLVVGDLDGVVVLPRAQVGAVIAGAQAREAKEADVLQQIAKGARTLDIYGLN
ncbi:MAG: 4-carboxy-4-hydroxy-2-oxoadipate aldolase/oxaloacetate decarboxylase [Burkholderiaceae bacterium]